MTAHRLVRHGASFLVWTLIAGYARGATPTSIPVATPTPALTSTPLPTPTPTPSPSSVPCPTPKILTRAGWGAKAPVLAMRPQAATGFVLHHSGEPQHRERTFTRSLVALQKFSQSRAPLDDGRIKPAWADIPYHFVINWDGQIGEARDLAFAGDTNTAYDPSGYILIDTDGDFETMTPDPRQIESIARLVAYLGDRYGIPADRLKGHRGFRSHGLPGREPLRAAAESDRARTRDSSRLPRPSLDCGR